jgi:hypothetical protein
MSDHQNENALRIAAYLENRLSPEEREAFKRTLGEDDELRLQYVDALMNKASPGPNIGGTGEAATRAADTVGMGEPTTKADPGGVAEPPEGTAAIGEFGETGHEAVIGEREEAGGEGGYLENPGQPGPTEAWEAGWPGGKKEARGGFLGSGWMVGAAALLLIIAGVVMYMMTSHQGFWDRTVAAAVVDTTDTNKGNGMDSARTATDAGSGAAGKATAVATTVPEGKAGLADSMYARLYKPYMRGDDPVELREYYQDYRTRNYAAVLAAGDSMVMKISPQKLLVRDYMRLYLGLSYLASGDGRNAVRELEGVVLRTKPRDALYEVARWYLALAWLKRNDVDPAGARDKAIGLARDISHSYSRYSVSARELVRALGS